MCSALLFTVSQPPDTAGNCFRITVSVFSDVERLDRNGTETIAKIQEKVDNKIQRETDGGRNMVKAIVYTSNTGTTAQYAGILAEKTGLSCYSMEEAKKSLKAGDEIIYLGWIMASSVKGYKDAKNNFTVRAVAGVGMRPTGTREDEVRNHTGIAGDIPVFVLQGGFDIKKLSGVYKLMMKLMVKAVSKKLGEKTDKTPDEEAMLAMMLHGADCVSEENMKSLLEWYQTYK